MDRQVLDDGSWFDREKAKQFSEDAYHDGNNYISRNTNSQWDETLWLTASGIWILNSWSDYRQTRETWETISPARAATWILRNGYEHETLATEIASREI